VTRLLGTVLLLVFTLLAAPWPAMAHEVRPALLQLTEVEADRFALLWRVPARGERVLALEPRMPANCQALGVPELDWDGARAEQRRELLCEGGLADEEIAIEGLQRLRTDVLIRVDYLNGGTETLRATPSSPTVTLAGRRDLLQVSRAYLLLGIEHILLGIDHLLFVGALLLLVSGWRRLVGTVTAFTLAHSLTLAGATLGLITAPAALIEALIALSIVFVAAEVIYLHQGKSTLTLNSPWLIAFAFGLLHGFGFAGALSAVGLPPEAVPAALLFFNLGVEAGQLLFITALLLIVRALAMLRGELPNWLRPGMAYGIGTLAAFWTTERIAAIWL
jgi:hydrogenase/urease accessory protein HupE